MSYFTRQAEYIKERKPRTKAAAQWVTKPLTNTQKAELAIAARAAYDIQKTHDLTDLTFDDWRHEQTQIACQKSSFKQCTNRDYRSIKAHFLRLQGKEKESKAIWNKTGRVKGSEELHDTHENRELALHKIQTLQTAHPEKLTDPYITAILADQHPDKTLADLTARQLQNLLYTLKNRTSAEGHAAAACSSENNSELSPPSHAPTC